MLGGISVKGSKVNYLTHVDFTTINMYQKKILFT